MVATSLGLLAVPVAPRPPSHQAPGFHRIELGDFVVIALSDGVVDYPTRDLFPGASPGLIDSALSAAGLRDPVGMSYSAFLIDTGDKQVLIDTGTGGKLADSPLFKGAGRVPENLRAAGYRPEQIDEIYITHLGPDHVGGLTVGSERAYPNAIVRAARREVASFLEVDSARAASPLVRFQSSLFSPYVEAGRFEAFDDDRELVAGIRAVATPGHTPGHTSYLVESNGRKLLVLGDLILVSAVQMGRPYLESSFDADRPGGAAQRLRILTLAADEGYLVAGSHLAFPGVGHIRRAAGAFEWAPIRN